MDILISGASTGIGRATAVHMARTGHQVWAGVRTERSFEDLVKMNVRGLHPLYLDVVDSQSIADAVSLVRKRAGTLYALINNAGIAVSGPVEGLSMEAWREQFDINFFGLIELTKICLPLLRESKGRIVNISSISGRVASPFLSPYATSKFAVEAFSDSIRRELRPFGVRVAVIEPGPINTPIWKKSLAVGHQRKSDLPQEILELYGPAIERFTAAMEQSELEASPVQMVVKAVEHALLSSYPKTRYPVGRGIGTMAIVAKHLSDGWLDKLLRLRG